MKLKIVLFLFIFCLTFQFLFSQVILFAGTGNNLYNGDGGQATLAGLSGYGIAGDIHGNIYICDNAHHCIRKVSSTGIISTIAGNQTFGFSGDGGPATSAQLNYPEEIKMDGYGNLYINDRFNYRIRKIDTLGNITTVAGNGTPVSNPLNVGNGGSALQAQIDVKNMAVDFYGNIYINSGALGINSGLNNIRKIDTAGIITNCAGSVLTPGYSGDGASALNSKLNYPTTMTADKIGNLYFYDSGNNVIRKIDTNGIITTFAGTGVIGYSGDNGIATNAKLGKVYYMTTNSNNELFFENHTYYSSNPNLSPENGSSNIRKIDSNGIINTIVDSTILTIGTTNGPYVIGPIHMDNNNNLYFNYHGACTPQACFGYSDLYRVYKINLGSGTFIDNSKKEDEVFIFPNPTKDKLHLKLNKTIQDVCFYSIYDISGKLILQDKIESTNTLISTSNLNKGIYFLQIKGDFNQTWKFVVE